MTKKRYALIPEEREKECPHTTYAWSGAIPCTGVLRCVMCGEEKPANKWECTTYAEP